MPSIDLARCEDLLARAAADGRSSLLEHEGLELLAAISLATPRFLFAPVGAEIDAAVEALGPRVVVKVVSPWIAHKSDVGGVRRSPSDRASVGRLIDEMRASVPRAYAERAVVDRGHAPAELRQLSAGEIAERVARDLRGFLVVEELPYRVEPGHELLVGVRHTDAFGPVVVLGMGGVHSEMWARSLGGRGVAMRSAATSAPAALRSMLDDAFVGDWLLGRTRTGEPLCDPARVVDVLGAFADLAVQLSPLNPAARFHLVELEVNPFLVGAGGLRPVDVLLRFGPAQASALPLPRPQSGIARMLRPSSAAIAGVSEKGMNVGRIILRNLLRDGFPRDRIYVLKASGAGEIDGCRCVATPADLPEAVDLCVVAIDAQQAPALVEAIERAGKAASVILIPGGMGEKEGSGSIEARIQATIRAARQGGGGAVYNGGNCLGVTSAPGAIDTMFIPPFKLPPSTAALANTAFISQSGAFVICRQSKQPHFRARYAISIGNQIDLTVSDYLRFARGDEGVGVVGLYVEGFRPLDGLAALREISALVESGRDVVVYKAGRTAAGRSSTSGHTASIAGDYGVSAALLAEAGAWVCDSTAEFEQAVKLLSFLHRKPLRGRRVGAISNAGFEAVALADNIESGRLPLTLPPFSEATARAIHEVFVRSKATEIVDVRNPLDVTPMIGDAGFIADVEAILADPGIDVGVISVVPLSAAINALPADPAVHREDVDDESSLARRLAALAARSEKPFVVTIDSGRLYDHMADILEAAAVPVLREADAAMRLLARFADHRLQPRRT